MQDPIGTLSHTDWDRESESSLNVTKTLYILDQCDDVFSIWNGRNVFRWRDHSMTMCSYFMVCYGKVHAMQQQKQLAFVICREDKA